MGQSQSVGTIIISQRALFREGVTALLKHTPYKVITTAQRPSDLKDVRAPAGSRILIILGIDDSDGDASESGENIKALRSLFPGSKVVVIAETRAPTNLQHVLMAAPDGYVDNLSSRDVLVKLLDVALLDQQVIVLSRPNSSTITAGDNSTTRRSNFGATDPDYDLRSPSLPVGTKDAHLSQREREILFRLAEGDSNKQIARLCNITESTVKVHLKAILRKITVRNRTQAAIWAIAKGYHVITGSERGPKTSYGTGDRPGMQGQRTSSNGKLQGLEVSAK